MYPIPMSGGNPEQELDFREAWSDAARAAAAAARKHKGRAARSSAAQAAYEQAGGERTADRFVASRHKAPNTEGISLSSNERPIDYGHVSELMREKYGKKRGLKSYEELINHPGVDRGIHFVVGTKIQKEKRAMLNDLGKYGARLEDYHYQSVYKKWRKLPTSKQSKPSKTSTGATHTFNTRGLTFSRNR